MGAAKAHLLVVGRDRQSFLIERGTPGAEALASRAMTEKVSRMKDEGLPVTLSTNRSKRSIAINLKTPKGRDLLLKLAETADVLLYNIRPQAMGRLGLSYEELHRINPKLIYVGAFGFSQRGPYASRPAYDDLIQGMSGLPWLSLKAG